VIVGTRRFRAIGNAPARTPLPTHYFAAGEPDAWSQRSFSTVMSLPLTTLLIGLGMGTTAFLVAGAKRAVRDTFGGVSQPREGHEILVHGASQNAKHQRARRGTRRRSLALRVPSPVARTRAL
jgi:hypothetical protein